MYTYPSVRLLFDRRHKASPKRPGLVEIEIYWERRRKWLSTSIRVLPSNWNPDFGVVARADSADLNLRIAAFRKGIDDHMRKLMVESRPFTWEGLKRMLESKAAGESFPAFVEKRIAERRDISEGTRRNHRKLLKALAGFGRINSFADLTRPTIVAFDQWLRSENDYMQSTVASYHKILKIYINEAIVMELLESSPYRGFKVDRGKSSPRRFLTSDELGRVVNAELPTETLRKARDLFLFQCYTGLAYADLDRFDFSRAVERNGRWVVHDRRHKTGEDFHMVLLPQAMEILGRNGMKLPLISNQQYNLRLKVLADAAGLDIPLTSHMGRHTFATLALNSGVKIEVLAAMMGHADIKTTQIYARIVNSTMERASDLLAGSLPG